MKTAINATLVGALVAATIPGIANAHFLMMHGTDPLRRPNQGLDLTLLFSHPFTAGPDMQLDMPLAFDLVHQRGGAEPATANLIDTLTRIEWTGSGGTVPAYRATIPPSMLRSAGDYTFVVVPAPYYEGTEDIYIQQITKLMVNIGGVPGNWDQPLGLPAEIVALNKPYANWVGGIFRGTVLSDGKPVPHAEIEVEYINYELGTQANAWLPGHAVETENPNLEVISVRADAQGNFAIGLPREGWWGIGALGVGPDTEHDGKELSQDALLWVHATAMDQPAAEGSAER